MKLKTTKPSAKPTEPSKLQVAVPPTLDKLAQLPISETVNHLLGPPKQGMAARAGFFSGLGIDLGLPLPHWVKEASRRGWKSCGFDFDFQSEEGLPAVLGTMAGLATCSPPDCPPEHASLASDIGGFLVDVAAKHGSKEEAAEFFTARAGAGAILRRLENIPQRAKVFLCIAAGWQTVEKFESAGELHLWLWKQKVILPQTSDAETRKVCRMIGLRLREKAGRPEKQK